MFKDKKYKVEVVSRSRNIAPSENIPVVFHGINKSGSLSLTNVLRKSYFDSGRAHQFFSHYHGTPSKIETLIDILNNTKGHAFFVSHYLYGAISTSNKSLLTVFRHPLPRVISGYSWLKMKHIKSGNKPEEFESLAEYARSSSRGRSQISQFAPGFPLDRKHKVNSMTAGEQLEVAKEAVERDIACIGIAEYFEETIFLFAHICGLKSVEAWRRDERNPSRQLVGNLSAEDQSIIKECYALEFEFYEFVLLKFHEQLTNVDIGGDIAAYKKAGASQYKDRILAPDAPYQRF